MVTGNEEINEVVWVGPERKIKKNIHISGPMVQSEALAVAKSLGNDQFKASTGWLDSFKKGHNIVWNGVCGESKDVDESVASINQNCLVLPYEPKNIHNADKKGLFFFGHYQQIHSWLRVKSEPGQNIRRKTCSVIEWKYGGGNEKT
jgi:hypothetical protein